MADRPIIFSAPMARALIDGRKTQTRRVLNLPTKTHSGGPIYERKDMGGWAYTTFGGRGVFSIDKCGNRVPVPERPAIWHQTTGVTMALPYAPGDRLYVREAWRAEHRFNDRPPRDIPAGGAVQYLADDPVSPWDARYRHARFMPRWASRLTLTVTDVRVQRLQDITEADAVAEGVYQLADQSLGKIFSWHQVGVINHSRGRSITTKAAGWQKAFHAYADLWDTLHGRDAWDANPWVAALTFTVDQRNIDAGSA